MGPRSSDTANTCVRVSWLRKRRRTQKRRGTERRPLWLEHRQNKEKWYETDWTEGGDPDSTIQMDDHDCVYIVSCQARTEPNMLTYSRVNKVGGTSSRNQLAKTRSSVGGKPTLINIIARSGDLCL